MTTDDQDAALAHLRTDLEITRDVLAQTERSLEAERAARVRAEGDAAAWLTFALLAELEAARKIVARWREMPRYYDDCDPGQNDPYYAWWAEMDDLVAAYDAAREG